MARPQIPAGVRTTPQMEVLTAASSAASSVSVFRNVRPNNPRRDRRQIAEPWQVEAYRHVNICGEARYSVTLFSAMAGRAEIGVAEPNTLQKTSAWVTEGPEVDLFNEIAPNVRDRSKLIRDYMTHYVIAGECYLIARSKVETDPGSDDFAAEGEDIDLLNHPDTSVDFAEDAGEGEVWEIVAVTELRRTGHTWEVRHDNDEWLPLAEDDPVIRLWNPDPQNRRKAWSPLRSLLPTLREIEWLTKHIFTQVRSRLVGAGVWFLPDNITYPAPPPEAHSGGAEAIAAMNEAEKFLLSLAASGMQQLDEDEVGFPSVVMTDPAALAQVDQSKLIQFWSEIDDKAMTLRSDAVRRFALGMDLPPEQVLGSSGLAVTGAGGSAGSVNHWGVWANEEQTISAHIEPALDLFVNGLTAAILRTTLPDSTLVISYNTASLRLRQDRSKEAMELYDRGVLKAEVLLRETGFDPDTDKMDDKEYRLWLLNRIAGGSATPEQVYAALTLLGVDLPMPAPALDAPEGDAAPETPGRNRPPSLKDHPYEGPPRVDHEHNDAPFGVREAAAEVLVLRALEKAGNRLLNDRQRGKDKDKTTPAHLAHLSNPVVEPPKFDFSLCSTVFGDLTAAQRAETERQLADFCGDLYRTGSPYTRDALLSRLEG